ncbi:MAG: hypothetical protein J6Y17_03295 [Elusimicrobiaceae bacterium]|nr:hypothetical protein [Elusimicrobiaceae bacterium]
MSEKIKNDLQINAASKEEQETPSQMQASLDPYAAISLPENSLLSKPQLAAFKQAATELKLPAEALVKWLSYEEERLQSWQQEKTFQRQEQLAGWAAQTQEEFGPRWQEEVSKAVRAADAFGGPQLRQLLEETGLGNHPVIVRTFRAVAKCISEDVTPGGVSHTTTDKTFTQALYGKN